MEVDVWTIKRDKKMAVVERWWLVETRLFPHLQICYPVYVCVCSKMCIYV